MHLFSLLMRTYPLLQWSYIYTIICKSRDSLFFYALILQGRLYLSPGNVAGQLIPAPPTCPGSTITFKCTVYGSGTTLWRVDGSSNLCNLVHLSTSTDTCGPSGKTDAFTANPETGFGTSNHSFTSTLSSTVTTALNGTLVECFGPASSLESGNRVGSSIIQVLGQ